MSYLHCNHDIVSALAESCSTPPSAKSYTGWHEAERRHCSCKSVNLHVFLSTFCNSACFAIDTTFWHLLILISFHCPIRRRAYRDLIWNTLIPSRRCPSVSDLTIDFVLCNRAPAPMPAGPEHGASPINAIINHKEVIVLWKHVLVDQM